MEKTKKNRGRVRKRIKETEKEREKKIKGRTGKERRK